MLALLKVRLKKAMLFLFPLLLFLGIVALVINRSVEIFGAKYIFGANDVPDADAILVLGAWVSPSGNVSTILADRLIVGHELYRRGKAHKILVSGDHGRTNYDEVNAMKNFLKGRGVPSQDIFMDHAGFTTYESIYRSRDIFQVKKVIIVTQEYHLTRAIFVARELGLEAYGVASDRHNYGNMALNNIREIAARDKDFLLAKLIKPKPTFLGETIPIFGDGRATDDE